MKSIFTFAMIVRLMIFFAVTPAIAGTVEEFTSQNRAYSHMQGEHEYE